jgi:ATP-dependent Lon protease
VPPRRWLLWPNNLRTIWLTTPLVRDEVKAALVNLRIHPELKAAAEQAAAEDQRSMSPMSAEATVVRNYLDWLLSIYCIS